MIKEGKYLFARGGAPIEPYKGKYAPKSADVFERMDAHFKMEEAWHYKPLRVEFELTTKCNDTCPHCGMGALPVAMGKTLTEEGADRMIDEFKSVGLPSVAVTGGEPFIAFRRLLYCMDRMRGSIDISKLTTNAFWGSEQLCERWLDDLVQHGLLENRFFTPLIMLSIGEQTTPFDRVCRIIRTITTKFTPDQLQVGVSSLKVRGETSKLELLRATYKDMYGPFPDSVVHSTIRIYLVNDRLANQAELPMRSTTNVTKWMNHCYDCFTPTVGAYVLPTALLKFHGEFYTCAAFNVPQKLSMGNIYSDGMRNILARANGNRYVKIVYDGKGLQGLASYVPKDVTDRIIQDSYCDSCSVLIDEFESRHGPADAAPLPIERREEVIPLIAQVAAG